jgi:hypothetical protein
MNKSNTKQSEQLNEPAIISGNFKHLVERFGDASTARIVAITITGVLKQLEIDKNIDIPEWIDLYERLSYYRL